MKFPKAAAILAWISFNLCALVGMPLLTFVVLQGDFDEARRVNPQMSTDGDSLAIPMFGVAILTFTVLLIINLGIGLVLWLVKRGAKPLTKAKSPIAEP